MQKFTSYTENITNWKSVAPEVIKKHLAAMKSGKSCGFDNIFPEHVLFTHPIAADRLNVPSKILFIHSFVPVNFCRSTMTPLLKGNDTDYISNRCTITPWY